MIDAALLFPKILARAGDNHELNQTAAKIAWQRIAGEGLHKYAVPLRLDEKTLTVAVADAIWQKQLQAMSSEMVFKINKLLRRETVRRIEFRIHPASLKNRAPVSPSGRRKSVEPLPANVVSAAAEIEDAELRNRFIRAAENCIARRDSRKSEFRIPQSEI
jgi:hypothetical protein